MSYFAVQQSLVLKFIAMCSSFSVIAGILGDAGRKSQMKYPLITLVLYFSLLILHVNMDESMSGIKQLHLEFSVKGTAFSVNVNKKMTTALIMLQFVGSKVCLTAWVRPNRFAVIQNSKTVYSVPMSVAQTIINGCSVNIKKLVEGSFRNRSSVAVELRLRRALVATEGSQIFVTPLDRNRVSAATKDFTNAVIHTSIPLICDHNANLFALVFKTWRLFDSKLIPTLIGWGSVLICLPACWFLCIRMQNSNQIEVLDILSYATIGVFMIFGLTHVDVVLLSKSIRSFEFTLMSISSLCSVIALHTLANFKLLVSTAYVLQGSIFLVLLTDTSISQRYIRNTCMLSLIVVLLPVYSSLFLVIENYDTQLFGTLVSLKDVMYACCTNLAFVCIRQLFRSVLFPCNLIFYRSALSTKRVHVGVMSILEHYQPKNIKNARY